MIRKIKIRKFKLRKMLKSLRNLTLHLLNQGKSPLNTKSTENQAAGVDLLILLQKISQSLNQKFRKISERIKVVAQVKVVVKEAQRKSK